MTSMNRQMNTGAENKGQMITLEATQNTTFRGKSVQAGQSVTVSKSEAKRLLSMAKVFRIKLD
jgi:uncharacterized protein YfdQ (DUF2303 family)